METDICTILYKLGDVYYSDMSDELTIRRAESGELQERVVLEVEEAGVKANWIYTEGVEVDIPIMSGDTQVTSITLNSENEWEDVSEPLPTINNDGSAIRYSVGTPAMQGLDDYVYTVNGSFEEGFRIDFRKNYVDLTVNISRDYMLTAPAENAEFRLAGDKNLLETVYTVPDYAETYLVENLVRLNEETSSEIVYEVQNLSFDGMENFDVRIDKLDVEIFERRGSITKSSGDTNTISQTFSQAPISEVKIAGEGLSGLNLADISKLEIEGNQAILPITMSPTRAVYLYMTGEHDFESIKAYSDQPQIVHDLSRYGYFELLVTPYTVSYLEIRFEKSTPIVIEDFENLRIMATVRRDQVQDYVPYDSIRLDLIAGARLSYYELPWLPKEDNNPSLTNPYWDYLYSTDGVYAEKVDDWAVISWDLADNSEDGLFVSIPKTLWTVNETKIHSGLLEVSEFNMMVDPETEGSTVEFQFSNALNTEAFHYLDDGSPKILSITEPMIFPFDLSDASSYGRVIAHTEMRFPAGSKGTIRFRLSIYEVDGLSPSTYQPPSVKSYVIPLRGSVLGADDYISLKPNGQAVLVSEGKEESLGATVPLDVVNGSDRVVVKGEAENVDTTIFWNRESQV